MIRLLTILFLFIVCHAKATVYYVSSTGNDALNGTTTGTSWATINKVNITAISGDTVRFKCGDTWNEKLTPAASNIYYGSYSTGAKPLITGFQTLTGWSNVGNIWSSTLSNSVRDQNTVYVNGALRAKGRFPNTGWLSFTSHVGKTQITGDLTGTPNYTGGELGIRVNHWVIDHWYILSQSGGTINIQSPGPYYNLTDGYGYFIQNIPSALDTANEWCIDTTTKVIKVYATTQPVAKASVIDTLVNISGKNNITLSGLQFSGANLTAIQLTNAANVTVINCDIYDCGNNGISGVGSNNYSMSSSSIYDCWNDGLLFFDFATGNATCNNATITGNAFSRIGTAPGMNKNLNQSSIALEVFGDKPVITNNVFRKTGYIPVYFYGDSAVVKNNYVDTFCFVKDDGGGLYTFVGSGAVKRGGRIVSNIVTNGIGAPAGTEGTNTFVFGIYLDNNSQHVTVDSNTVVNCSGSGFVLHIGDSCTITNNTFVYNKTSQLKLDNLLQFTINDDLRITNNIMYSASDNVEGVPYILDMAAPGTRLPKLGLIDSNFYSKPSNESKIIKYISQFLTIQQFQDSGFEAHTKALPVNVTSDQPLLKANPSKNPVAYSLAGTYVDPYGTLYTNAIVLQPYRSALLYKYTTNIPQQNAILRLKYKQ